MNDAGDDAVDAGCSLGAPRCTGELLSERVCEENPQTDGPPRQGTETSGSSGPGCSITRSDESPTGLWLLMLIGWAGFRKRQLGYAV